MGFSCNILSRNFIRLKSVENLTKVSSTVSDVARYSEFVPFCTKSALDNNSMIGTLTVEYGPVRTTWASDVTITDDTVLARNHGGDVVKTLSTGMFELIM